MKKSCKNILVFSLLFLIVETVFLMSWKSHDVEGKRQIHMPEYYVKWQEMWERSSDIDTYFFGHQLLLMIDSVEDYINNPSETTVQNIHRTYGIRQSVEGHLNDERAECIYNLWAYAPYPTEDEFYISEELKYWLLKSKILVDNLWGEYGGIYSSH